jgi:predicted TIM-barrel fold metal-dependent hydrolase
MAGWFPEVPVIVDVGFRPSAPPASLGQALPAEGRIAETALETPNIYLGLTAMAAVELYLIKRLLTVVGAERLIFGSNAPYGIPAIAVEGFRLAQLGDSVEEGVLGETLRQLYRLS